MIWNAQYGPSRERTYRRTGAVNMRQRMTWKLPLVTVLAILAVAIAAL
jgi:hypothetical protein